MSGKIDEIRKEQKKELMKWPKGDLAERLLFAYRSLQHLEKINADHSELVRELVEALERGRSFLPQRSSAPNIRTEIGDVVNLIDATIAKAKGAGF